MRRLPGVPCEQPKFSVEGKDPNHAWLKYSSRLEVFEGLLLVTVVLHIVSEEWLVHWYKRPVA